MPESVGGLGLRLLAHLPGMVRARPADVTGRRGPSDDRPGSDDDPLPAFLEAFDSAIRWVEDSLREMSSHLDPLTARDRDANGLSAFFNFSQPARKPVLIEPSA